ncbi:hypothetical protein V8F06_014222 [Rhypophila decipiens]
MSGDKINQLFWLYYGQAIKDTAGANFGSTGAFFLASEAQKGPLAGSAVPDEYTNTGLHDIADNLLADDNLFYNTSALHGYAEALQNYLNWVDLGSHASKALDTAYLNALLDQSAAENAYLTQRKKAVDQYKLDSTSGFVPDGQNLLQWIAAGNAPALVTASKARDAAAATVTNLQGQINGPLAAQVTSDRTKLAQGLNKDTDLNGFNMHCALGNILSPQELIRKLNNGEKVPPPTFQRLPLYQAPAYKDAVQDMERKIGTDYKPNNSVSFTIDTNKSTSDFNFGQTTAGASVGVSYGWFSFNAGGSSSESKSVITSASESENVSVKITYDKFQVVPITLGDWNIDVSKYKLRSDAPKELKNLARVTSLVLASGLGYEITVGATAAGQIDTHYQKTVSAGGSVSIFGIPIGLGGSGSSTEESASHSATWDSASKTFKVVPSDQAGYASVVGLMGEKFNIL